MRHFLNITLFIFLTILTQIGGIVYGLSLLFFRQTKHRKRLKRSLVFIGLYLFSTFSLVPNFAPIFGREKIRNSAFVQPHSIFYILANRNYVTPELNKVISSISEHLNAHAKGIQLVYLDANFPFMDGFPLLPHLSHNDGKKLDVTFIYKTADGTPTNLKRSRSGYGVYEEPANGENNQTNDCIKKGYWQYGFSKHLSFGEINDGITLDELLTSHLARCIIKEKNVEKLFIEPHLKNRLKLNSTKVRFQGCHAVRHDDHIHLQVK